MKLFKNIARAEGYEYDESAHIVFGKSLEGGNDRHNGWYIRIDMPIMRNMKYLCPVTFENKIGDCKYKLLFRIRKTLGNKYYSIHNWSVWVPINESANIRYDDPYISALDIKDKI